MNLPSLHTAFLASSGVSTDSRNIPENCIFFALKGERFDGNTFAEEALKQGAQIAVCDNPALSGIPGVVIVENSLTTLQQLARFHRQQMRTPIIALTGSNGKTTTKELIRAVLSKKFRTLATQGNLNNHIGVPLTLLRLSGQTEIGIVEMGANHQKEIAALCDIALPDYGCITNYGKAHLEGFGGVQGVIKGKSEMYDHLKAQGKCIFYHADDPIMREKVGEYQPSVSFGSSARADLHIKMMASEPFVKVQLGQRIMETQLIGAYNYSNVCLAILMGCYFSVPIEDIAEAIREYRPDNNRSQLMEVKSHKVIMDAYNANPSSMQAALENFARLSDTNKLAILGDMFELGADAPAEHQHMAALAEKLGLKEVWLVGKNFFNTKTSYPKFETFEALSSHLKSHPIQNKSLLIKGSRGMALERVLDLI